MDIVIGVMTVISIITFLGIIAWAWSRHRVKDNEEAAQLPFAVPDEETTTRGKGLKK